MGLESYLFYIKFRTAPSLKNALASLQDAGMYFLKEKSTEQSGNNFGDYYFEIRTKLGLVEAHVIVAPDEIVVEEFSLRFSVLSPKTVVDVAFEFLAKLHERSPIDVYDTEIRNHIFRQLRREGKVDISFEGLAESEGEAINKLSVIPISADDFKKNALEIGNRKAVLGNEQGEIVEGGSATFERMERKGLVARFLGWVKGEL